MSETTDAPAANADVDGAQQPLVLFGGRHERRRDEQEHPQRDAERLEAMRPRAANPSTVIRL